MSETREESKPAPSRLKVRWRYGRRRVMRSIAGDNRWAWQLGGLAILLASAMVGVNWLEKREGRVASSVAEVAQGAQPAAAAAKNVAAVDDKSSENAASEPATVTAEVAPSPATASTAETSSETSSSEATGASAAADSAAVAEPDAASGARATSPSGAPVSPPAPSASASSPAKIAFKDERPLAADTTSSQSAISASTEAASADTPRKIAFRDERPLAAPSFRDTRPVAKPSFQDTRALAPAAGAATTAASGAEPASSAANPAAATPETEEVSEEPKPFEVGYFLDDRSPMARAMEKNRPDTAEKQVEEVEKSEANTASPAQAAPGTGAAPTVEAAAPDTQGGSAVPTLVALAPGQLRIDPASCAAPEVQTEPLDGGMMRLRIDAQCHANELVQITYGGAEFIRKLDGGGVLDYRLDCFAGAGSSVGLRFADGTTRSVPVVAKDLDKVSKIAVIWRQGVNLDLHVFEYAARIDAPGHLWARAPGAYVNAEVQTKVDARGHGFLSSADDDRTLGDKVEVYTFLHSDQQTSGSISLALDNESRGEMPSGAHCGQGALAEVDFQVAILPRNGQVSRQGGVLTRVECGARLSQEARFNQAAMPGLRIRK